jgi:hypothetical protein
VLPVLLHALPLRADFSEAGNVFGTLAELLRMNEPTVCVCLCVCVCVCMCLCVCVSMCLYVSVYVSVCVCVCL